MFRDPQVVNGGDGSNRKVSSSDLMYHYLALIAARHERD